MRCKWTHHHCKIYYDNYFAANDGYSNPDLAPAGLNNEVIDPRSNSFLRGQQYASDGTELIAISLIYE